jgi:glucokinase
VLNAINTECEVTCLEVLSIDFGGSHIAVAVVRDGAVLAQHRRTTEARLLADELNATAAMARSCAAACSLRFSEFAGVAVGFCGVVDAEGGQILSTLNKYPDALQTDWARWAWREFGLALRLQNDACLALLGEVASGAAQGYRDVVMVTLGTGIGGAAMIDGRLLHSRAGQAGCLGGHLPVNFAGRRCPCGAIGCAEAEASTAVLPQLLREHPGFAASVLAYETTLDFRALFRAADAADLVAQAVLDHCLHVWSVLAVGLIHAYGPEVLVFGGGVLQRGEVLLEPIRRYVEQHMWRTSRGVPHVVAAGLGEQAALIGGATLFPGSSVTNASRAHPRQASHV